MLSPVTEARERIHPGKIGKIAILTEVLHVATS
jgi:hypothetical protein